MVMSRMFFTLTAAAVVAAFVVVPGHGKVETSSSSVSVSATADTPVSRHEVTSLPGWVEADGVTPAALPSKMYTGYIPAGTPPSGKGTMYFHYWAVMAEENPATAPTVLWYNGGPGASSLFGLLQEWGPLRLTERSYDERYNETGVPTPKLNPFRWTKKLTMIAIDSPPPMGLSFCSEAGPSGGPTSCGPWTDKSVFAANHAAHKALLTEIFPELAGNPLYLTGESYAGIVSNIHTRLLFPVIIPPALD